MARDLKGIMVNAGEEVKPWEERWDDYTNKLNRLADFLESKNIDAELLVELKKSVNSLMGARM